ncbi:MAG: phage virion morphogenesis protein [Treponema sp.]|jgi:phage gpG-like protein|nr:phage virion morphogenesis protein [Treponema sp.]
MGAAVEIKLQEIDKLAQKLNAFVLSGGDKSRLLSSLGEVIVGQTQERFGPEIDPQGDRWHELTERYKKRKIEDSRGGILDRGGLMLQSIEPQLQGSDTVLVGTPMEYAIYHQDAKNEKRRREFLGYSTDNIAELEDAVDEFMKEHVA